MPTIAEMLEGAPIDYRALRVALYGNEPTPDHTRSVRYGDWEGERWDAGHWEAGGMPISVRTESAEGRYVIRADDLVSGSAANLTGVYGALVHAGRGLCFLDFGGENTVVNGRFTVVWSPLGVMELEF